MIGYVHILKETVKNYWNYIFWRKMRFFSEINRETRSYHNNETIIWIIIEIFCKLPSLSVRLNTNYIQTIYLVMFTIKDCVQSWKINILFRTWIDFIGGEWFSQNNDNSSNICDIIPDIKWITCSTQINIDIWYTARSDVGFYEKCLFKLKKKLFCFSMINIVLVVFFFLILFSYFAIELRWLYILYRCLLSLLGSSWNIK